MTDVCQLGWTEYANSGVDECQSWSRQPGASNLGGRSNGGNCIWSNMVGRKSE